MKIQRENGVYFVDLGEGWSESLLLERNGCGLDVYFGPTASFEEVRRPITDAESTKIKAAILDKWPEAYPKRFV